jgi:ABC-type sugar transport system ATPase subunit
MVFGGRSVPLGWPAIAARAGVRYVPPDRRAEGLFLGQSVERNLTATRLGSLSRAGIVLSRRRRRTAERLREIVGLRTPSIRQTVARLSGGNQQKTLIGRCLDRTGGALLLLDDPTRGVDVHGRAEIHRLIRKAATEGDMIVFSSTELDELLELADIVVTMLHGQVVSARPRSEVTAAQILGEMTHAVAESAA